MSEAERDGRAEEDPADGVRVVRRYKGVATAEDLILNLIRAHTQHT